MGKNRKNGVADVATFPAWLPQLREISPITEQHSFLVPYWYRARERWVLYDGLPIELIDPKQPMGVGAMGHEVIQWLRGPAPRDLEDWQRSPWVSDVQHEMHRLYGVYARPFWVLQGESGGHQVRYSPEQVNFLTQCGAAMEPPAIGSLPPCPFDNRVTVQLQRLSRLVQLNGSVERLRKEGSSDAAEARLAADEKEIRRVSMAMLEAQLSSVGEMVASLGGRKNVSDSVIRADGQASKASEAIAAYIETGQYIM
jgi:hypothetical protein